MDFSKKPEHENPRKGANLISQLFLLWTAPMLWKGMKNGLTAQDLTKCLQRDKSNALGDDLERAWKRELEYASKNRRKPRLWRALFQVHSKRLFGLGFYRLFDIHLRTLLPLILAQLLIQFQKPTVSEEIHTNVIVSVNATVLKMNDELFLKIDDIIDIPRFVNYMWNDAFGLATLLVLTIFISTLIVHHGVLGLNYLSTRMRIACCSLMYRKSIRLSASAASQTGIGHVVNLMSNDVARLEKALLFGNSIWILPIQSVVVAYLIWQRARWVGVIGVTFLLLTTVPVQTYLGHYRSSLRRKVAWRTDKRIEIMNEIVQGIQVIKMYAWEIPFQKVVAEARRLEIQKIRISSYVGSICGSSCYFVGRSTLFVSIVVLILTEQRLTADIVFSMSQFYHILQLNATILYPMALACGAEALVSLQRIEDFLLKDEKNEMKDAVKRRNSDIACENKENAVELYEVSANWENDSSTNTLSKIDLKIESGKICAVVGPVGSGKSSLIQLLLGELPVQSGEVIVNGSISYAAQEPWIFSETVRNNILFGESYDRKRYNEVVECCDLTTDFEQMPNGDRTFVGDRGASLSGGQRARISLARAMYKKATIYLLDDPLSAVDAHVGKHLFDEVIGPNAQIAKNATRILVTHQVHLLKEADMIVIIENGQITDRGTYAELSVCDIDFAKLLEQSGQIENKEEILNDDLLNGTAQAYEDERSENESDNTSNSLSFISITSMDSQEFDDTQINEEEQIKDSSTWRTFFHYFAAGSSRFELIFLTFVIISTQYVVGVTDYFLKYLTYQESKRDNGEDLPLTQAQYLYIYGALIILLISICTFRSILFYSACMRSSKDLHNRMFSGILNAPMRFFDQNPAGRILNRISSDMGLIDEVLPPNIVDAVGNMVNMCGILILIIIVNPTMIAILPLAMVLFGLFIKLYVRASQDLTRLEGICRSPVFSYLTATINGLTTIRTRNINQKLCHEFDELQDVHSSVSQLSASSAESYGMWMDCVSTAFLAALTYNFIILYDNTYSGNVGLAICQALMLTGMVQYGVRRLTDAMQQMTNVERIIQYAELKPEYSPPKKPSAAWPSSGNIKFHNMSLRYDSEGEPTLENISLEIQSGSKIGIVGRTGAGKSSLIAALFRLTHIEGLIEIDGVNTETISLASLRSKISIIPQNPVLFSGTLRRNLDPFEEYSDDDIWKALENVQMKEVLSLVLGLNMEVMTNGSNFSVGQRQLLCLARAILRKNRILVLDEATANVDPQTDQLIQQAIRERFAHCTVLTVAHRLNTIIDSDRILVMDAGKCVEFDTPINLLSIEKGIFKGMIEALGDKEYDRLHKISSFKTAK